MKTHKTIFLLLALTMPLATQAAFQTGTHNADVLIGRDDDDVDNPLIQPPEFPVPDFADQSLNDTDVQAGRGGNDVLIGLLGEDVQLGGLGHDILIGGTEQGTPPNSDVSFGDQGNDTFVWAGGDGSDAFAGGHGHRDALIFGTIDRDANNVPILSPAIQPHARTGVPTADVSGQAAFCRLEPVEDADFGFDFLVRFFSQATGGLIVTLRVVDVEQVFCTSEQGGAITFADLTDPHPEFVEVSLEQVRRLNGTVGQIIR
ncbi:MAG: hypothetical protein ACREVE_13675 [Gammaproteobacteria bacterium]